MPNTAIVFMPLIAGGDFRRRFQVVGARRDAQQLQRLGRGLFAQPGQRTIGLGQRALS